jgi:hypothetical protein
MQTFLKTGFQPAGTTRKSTPPLSDTIRKIIPGTNSGQVKVWLVAQAGALSYQFRRAAVGPGGALGDWVEQPVGSTRPAVLVTGLTPGTAYGSLLIFVNATGNPGKEPDSLFSAKTHGGGLVERPRPGRRSPCCSHSRFFSPDVARDG